MMTEQAAQAINEKWDALDTDLREALVEWYNIREVDLDEDDYKELLGLVEAGRFWFWDCPICEERCVHGDPEDWSNFQGVSGQDWISYPGDSEFFNIEALAAMCDQCRVKCYTMPEEGEYPPV